MTRLLTLLVACSVAVATPGAASTEEASMSEGTQPINRSAVRSSVYAIPDDLGCWQPWEATDEAIGEYRREVAQALDLSYPMIQRQCRPHNGTGTGKRSDLERIALRVNKLRDLRVDENRAMLEVWWLNDFCGYERPKPKGGVIVTESCLITQGRFAKESADVVVVVGELEDADEITASGRRRLGREIREARIALDNLELKYRLGAEAA